MSHIGASNNTVPFCQQNTRLWVGVLLLSAVLVLGFALYLAFEDGRFTGLTRFKGEGASMAAAAHTGPVAAAIPRAPATGVAPAVPAAPAGQGPATPVALTQPYAAGGAPTTVAAMGGRVPGTEPLANPNAAGESLLRVARNAGPDVARQLQLSFNQVADKIRPCVVNINAVRPSRQVQANRAGDPRFIDPFDGIPDKVFGRLAYESVGSGLIVDPKGLVVTNDHLVSGALSIVVTRFDNKQPIEARLVATDRQSDLAVLQLQGNGPYPAGELANSSKVEVGDWVIAVGNPFGLGHTVTAGIISSRRSAIVISGVEYRDLLQTDAPINQGSSGGPLVGLDGKVVGINTAIYAPTGVFNGTGFAIPSNRVGAFVSRVMAGETAARTAPAARGGIQQVAAGRLQPWLGVGVSEMSPALANKLQMNRMAGVFVNSVAVGSPAAKAELRRGDVIIGMAGHPVNDGRSLKMIVAALPPGLKVPVTVWRGGRARTRKLRLAIQPPGGAGL